MRVLPNAGVYTGSITEGMKPVIEKKEKSGVLMLHVPVTLSDAIGPDGARIAWSGPGACILIGKDGNLNAVAIQQLKKVFPSWDGVDFFWLEGVDENGDEADHWPEMAAAKFEVEGERLNNYIPEGQTEPIEQFKLKPWINAVGGGTRIPERVTDRAALLREFGSKFRANAKASPKTVKPAAEKEELELDDDDKPAKGKSAPAPSKKSGPPAKPGSKTSHTPRTATLDEAWDAYYKKCGEPDDGTDEAEKVGNDFLEAQDAIKPKDGNNLTPAEWGKVMDYLEC